jgi:ArsR family transcriptional regulator, arsenate/arsenite/antimonite-responsive transcriptional repressor
MVEFTRQEVERLDGSRDFPVQSKMRVLVATTSVLGLDTSIILDILTAMATRARPDPARSAQLFHALSDETRLSLLERLRVGERCVCDLTDALDAAQSRLSFHLKVLKDAGLVTDRREGRWMYYRLNPEALSEAAELAEALASAPTAAERKNGCC